MTEYISDPLCNVHNVKHNICGVTAGENEMPTLQLLAEHGEEDGEVDGAAGLLDHGLELLILHVQLACTTTKKCSH